MRAGGQGAVWKARCSLGLCYHFLLRRPEDLASGIDVTPRPLWPEKNHSIKGQKQVGGCGGPRDCQLHLSSVVPFWTPARQRCRRSFPGPLGRSPGRVGSLPCEAGPPAASGSVLEPLGAWEAGLSPDARVFTPWPRPTQVTATSGGDPPGLGAAGGYLGALT